MKCPNPNSKFVQDLEAKQDIKEEQAKQIYVQLESKEFQDWFGYSKKEKDGKVGYDTYDYPRLTDNLYIINKDGDKIRLFSLINSEEFAKVTNINNRINDLDGIKSVIVSLNISLQKKISNFNKSDYAINLQESTDKIKGLDTELALIEHTKFILKTIKSFQHRLYEYENFNEVDADEETLKNREDVYFNFLMEATQFTTTFEIITKLPEPKGKNKLNSIINQLRYSEATVSDLKNTINEEIKRIWSARLKGLSTNPLIVSNALDFLVAQEDESGAQRWLDALTDSHNPVLANLGKLYNRQQDYARMDSIKQTRQWKKWCEENGLKTEADFKKFSDDNGKFVEEYNYAEYYQAMNKAKEPMQKLENEGKRYKEDGETHTHEYTNAKHKYYDWRNLNTVSADNYKSFLPSNKWKNEKYSKLSKTELTQLDYIQNFLYDLIKHTNYQQTIDGKVKIMNDTSIGNGAFPAFDKNVNSKKDKKEFVNKVITEANDIVRFIPFEYMKKLNQKELPEIIDSMSDEEKETTQLEIDKIKKENKLSHADALNYNLFEVMPSFIKVANINKRKNEMKLMVDATVSQFKDLKITQKTARGNTLIDKIASTTTGTKVEYEKNAIDSNSYKHLLDWVEGVFYEEFNLDEGDLTKFAARAQNVASVLGIGFNALSAINNKIVGNIQLKIEAAGGQYFNYKELTQGRKQYFDVLLNLYSEHGIDKSNTISTGVIKYFDIIQSHDELVGKANNSANYKIAMLKNITFFMQEAGEHQIQNTSLLTMLNSHRMVNGKPISYQMYAKQYDISAEVKKMKKEGKPSEEINKYIDANKIDEKKTKAEFEAYPKLIDEFELVDGLVSKKKDSTLTDEEESNFRQRVIGFNQKLHGVYNIEDAGMLQRYALGRLGMQFRKWIPNAWNRRFGNKFGKSYYMERREEENEGMYISTYKYISSPFTGSYDEYRKEKKSVAEAAFLAIFKGLKETITNAKINWHVLSPMEKANVKRTLLEAVLLVAAIIIGSLLKGDDDDEEKNWLQVWGISQCDRLYGELSTFAPWGVLREGNKLFDNPTAVFKTFDSVSKLVWNTVKYPFLEEDEREIHGGVYSGRDKVSVAFLGNIPLVNQVQKLMYLENTNRQYIK